MYSLYAAQLDICNIYTSKFCTRPKFIQQQQQPKKRKKKKAGENVP